MYGMGAGAKRLNRFVGKVLDNVLKYSLAGSFIHANRMHHDPALL